MVSDYPEFEFEFEFWYLTPLSAISWRPVSVVEEAGVPRQTIVVLYVVLCRISFVFLSFSFRHCIVCSSIYGF